MTTARGRLGYFLAYTALFLFIPSVTYLVFSQLALDWRDVVLLIIAVPLFVLGWRLCSSDSYMKSLGWRKWLMSEPLPEWRYRGDRALITFGVMMLVFTLQNSRSSYWTLTTTGTIMLVLGPLALLIGWIDVLRGYFQEPKKMSRSE